MKKIGFIGAGNMATAIIKGLIAQNGTADNLGVFDTDDGKCRLMEAMGVSVYPSSAELVRQCDIIVLAVKPQNYAEVLAAVKEEASLDKTFVSIAAGISIAYVRGALGCDCPVVRVMPNTPLLLKKGASALCPSDGISDGDKELVYRMFAGSGVCEYITEDHMNEIIAVEVPDRELRHRKGTGDEPHLRHAGGFRRHAQGQRRLCRCADSEGQLQGRHHDCRAGTAARTWL